MAMWEDDKSTWGYLALEGRLVEVGRWVIGFDDRQAAISAARKVGATRFQTAVLSMATLGYYARFRARSVLEEVVASIEQDVSQGRCASSKPLGEIREAVFPEGEHLLLNDKDFERSIDLMNMVGSAVNAWAEKHAVDIGDIMAPFQLKTHEVVNGKVHEVVQFPEWATWRKEQE